MSVGTGLSFDSKSFHNTHARTTHTLYPLTYTHTKAHKHSLSAN